MKFRHLWAMIIVAANLPSTGCDDTPGSVADVGVADVGVSDVGVADVGVADVGVAPACDSTPLVRTTTAGVQFVRTPESCFKGIPDFSYKPKYVEIDGMRQAYVEDGPANADPVLLLHGQPSWGYLYRKMIHPRSGCHRWSARSAVQLYSRFNLGLFVGGVTRELSKSWFDRAPERPFSGGRLFG